MSVEQENVVDFISVSRCNEVVLTISDHLPWCENDGEHLLLLQEKINAYLSFIESGELLSSYPEADGKKVVIQLRSKYEPSEEADVFLRKVKEILSSIDVTFRVDVEEIDGVKNEDVKKID